MQKSPGTRFSYRMKLSAQFFGLTLLTIGGLSYFFLSVYIRDKLASSYERELSDAVQAAQYLENTLLFARQASAEQIHSSPAVVFALENPCGGDLLETVSQQYVATFERLQLTPKAWMKSDELSRYCAEIGKAGGVLVLTETAEQQFPVPTVLALVEIGTGRSRLVLISMDSFAGARADGLLGLVDRNGSAVWSSAGTISPFNDKLGSVGASAAELGVRAEQTGKQGLPSVGQIGKGGIAAVAPVLSKWVLVALAAESSVLSPVRYLVKQALWLTAGFFFLCLLAGKLIADRVSRPLQGLSGVAQEFGKGNLSARVEVTQTDEFGVLQETFNSMAGKIETLLEETRNRALLEADVQLAVKVQEMLFPPSQVRLGEHEISSFVRMATKCGGDWWGYIDVPGNEKSPLLLLLIGDVTGHGISSALLTAAAQGGASVLSSWVREQPDLARDPRFLLKLFNRAVYESARGTVQMSFFSAVIDVNAEVLYASNAAHNWPYLIAPSEGDGNGVTISTVGNSSLVLGQVPDVEFTEIVSVPWKPGSQLFLYTDGLIDAYHGDTNRFDRRALVRVLRQSARLQGAALLKKVLESRAAVVGEITQEDDITAVVCVRKVRK